MSIHFDTLMAKYVQFKKDVEALLHDAWGPAMKTTFVQDIFTWIEKDHVRPGDNITWQHVATCTDDTARPIRLKSNEGKMWQAGALREIPCECFGNFHGTEQEEQPWRDEEEGS